MSVIASYSSFGKLQWRTHKRPKSKDKKRYKVCLWTIGETVGREETELKIGIKESIRISDLIPLCLSEMTDLINTRKDIQEFGFEVHAL